MDASPQPYALFKAAFRGRTDVVPRYWQKSGENGQKGHGGYSPICSNLWKETVCPKRDGQKVSCAKCPNLDHVPLSDTLLAGHFGGEHILGVYPLLPDGTCWFLAADFDDHSGTGNPLPDVRGYAAALTQVGLTPYVLRSKSGKGYHVYLFFAAPVPAWKARRVAFSCLKDQGLVGSEVEISSFDRLFPNQDELTPTKPLGNLIGLPFQGKAASLGNTTFLDPATGYDAVLDDQLAVFTNLQRVTEADLDRIIATRGLSRDIAKPTNDSQGVKNLPAPVPVPAIIPQTLRNETLFKLACSLQAKGLGDDAILQAVRSENQVKCTPPLDDQEVEAIVQGVVSRYTKGGVATTHLVIQVTLPDLTLPAVSATGTSKTGGTGSGSQLPGVNVQTMLPDAPVSAHAVVPDQMILSIQNGIEVMVDDGKGNITRKRVFPAPVVIAERLSCLHSGKEQVKLAWHMDGDWRYQTVDRKVIADVREIVSLASFGLPITSDHKEFLVRFLQAYGLANRSCIPLTKVSNRFGWQNDNACFLWGRNLITDQGIWTAATIQSNGGPTATGANTVVFRGSDEGDEQVAEGFHHAGLLDSWIGIVNRATEFPTPFVILLAACAPPLLHVIGASNFVVETAGITSTGKTTVQRLAASVWGCPDERSEASVLYTWDTTRVWVERVAGLLNGLPLILDDTKRVFSSLPKDQARAMVNAVIYTYASGKGRGRGSVQGTQRTGSFRSILISSGEEPCVDSSTQHGGARARVLSLWGAPFGTGNQAQLVKAVNLTVMEHYGFAGPMLVRHFLLNRRFWPMWKDEYQQLLRFYSDLGEGNNVAGRLSEIFAVLEIVSNRLREAVPGLTFSRSAREVLTELWKDTVSGSAQAADRALAALRDIYDWSAANQQKFYGRHKKNTNQDPIEPYSGWAGRWDDDHHWDHIAYLRKPLQDRLEAFGYDASATIRTWADRGWLMPDAKGRKQRQTRIDGAVTSCYCLRRAVLESELGLDFKQLDITPPMSPF